MGETVPELWQAFCHVKEATPDSLGFRFPVVVLYVLYIETEGGLVVCKNKNCISFKKPQQKNNAMTETKQKFQVRFAPWSCSESK